MGRNLNLLHLANFNSSNIGNGALILGCERLLREDYSGGSIHFIPEPWDDYTFDIRTFDESFVEKVNATDGLLIGGAVAINARPYLTRTGMRFDLPLPLWRNIKRPIIFYGIAYRVWPYQKFHHLDQFIHTVTAALQNDNVLFGVRNDGTKEWIEGLLGFRSDKLIEVPDPGVFVTTEHSFHEQIDPKRINVILALNNEDELFRYGGRLREHLSKTLGGIIQESRLNGFMKYMWLGEKRRKRIVKEIATAVEKLCEQHNLNIILVPHYLDDFKMMAEFNSALKPRIAHQHTVSFGMLKVPHAKYFYDLYAKADLVLSMRIHSLSPSIGLGTPMLALSTQDRITAFMNKTGLNRYLIDVFSNHLSDQIVEKVNAILKNRDAVKNDFDGAKQRMRDRMREFNIGVFQLLGKRTNVT